MSSDPNATPEVTVPSADVQPSAADSPKPDVATADVPADAPKAKEFVERSRADKRMRAERAKLDAERKEIEAIKEKARVVDEFANASKADQIAMLERLGWSYEDLTNHYLSLSRKDPELSAVEKEIAELKAQLESERAEKRRTEQSARYSEFVRDVREAIDQAGEDTAHVRAMEAYDAVVARVDAKLKGVTKQLSEDELFALVAQATSDEESYLRGVAERLAKAKAKAEAKGDGAEKQDEAGAPRPLGRREEQARRITSTPITTLTNGSVTMANPAPQQLARSRAEGRERALATYSALAKK